MCLAYTEHINSDISAELIRFSGWRISLHFLCITLQYNYTNGCSRMLFFFRLEACWGSVVDGVLQSIWKLFCILLELFILAFKIYLYWWKNSFINYNSTINVSKGKGIVFKGYEKPHAKTIFGPLFYLHHSWSFSPSSWSVPCISESRGPLEYRVFMELTVTRKRDGT